VRVGGGITFGSRLTFPQPTVVRSRAAALLPAKFKGSAARPFSFARLGASGIVRERWGEATVKSLG